MRAEDENLIEQMFDNKRQYQIPVYQRNYDWKKENCQALFNDVIEAYKNSNSHFLGSIVQVQQDEENGIKKFVIIDGQQRMTSIYLLMKALYDNSENDVIKEELYGLLYNTSLTKKYDIEDKNKLKLKPIKSDNEQFILLMLNKIDAMDKSSNIFINYNSFCEWIKLKKQEDITTKNILQGIKKIRIVMISLKEPEDDPQIIFERLNSTGEDLKLSDLIRNYLLMTDKNMEDYFETYWLPMEEKIGKNYINDFFSSYLVYKLPDSKEKNSYQSFKRFSDKNQLSHKEILEELLVLSKYYKAFTGRSSEYSDTINNLLAGYRQLKQSTIYPFFFSLFLDFEKKCIDENVLIEVLSFFLNYTIRRLIVGLPSNSLRGLYKNLYRRIFIDAKAKLNYLKSIYSFMASIPSTKDVMPNNTIVKDRLVTENIYKNNNLCKFILTTLENGLSSKEMVLIDDRITIEHIMPQNKNNTFWKKEIGEEFEYVYDKYLHTLGNLTLTGYNSELSDSSFYEKKELLKSSKFTYLNCDVIDKIKWEKTSIENRANRLSSKLLEVLKLPPIFENPQLTSQTIIRHSVDDNADLTKKRITSFILLGEHKIVKSATDMLIQVCEILESLDSNKMDILAKSNYVKSGASTPLISYDKTLLRTPRELNNTGIFVETNKSTNDIRNTIKKLIEEFGLGYDDFIFHVE